MEERELHLRRTAQIWRSGEMIWPINITLTFAIYELYILDLSTILTVGSIVVIAAITMTLFVWVLKTLRLAKKTDGRSTVDNAKRRKMRKGFLIVFIIEVVGFNITPFVLLYFNHIEYIVPVEILICAIHFLPLTRTFEMQVYYWLGSIVSVITLLTSILIPALHQIGNLAVMTAIPSLCFTVCN